MNAGVKKIVEYAALVSVIAGMGKLFINTEVERRMEELAKDPGKHPVIVELVTESDNTQEQLVRIEGKVDAFSTEFTRYLQRRSGK